MHKSSDFKMPLIVFILSLFLIVLCYSYVDRPVVFFLHAHHARKFSFLKVFANDIILVLNALMFIFYLYFFVRVVKNKLNLLDRKILLVCNSILIAAFLVAVLKIIFARYWPASFIDNNASLINGGSYSFRFFSLSRKFQSFPSGHASFIFACAVSVWLLFPKLRWLASVITLLVVIGQIGMYYHFVSDMIAGATVGGFVAFYTYQYNRHFADG